jgi:nitrite reductase/ring-hydroxylating ferredoxin subunit
MYLHRVGLAGVGAALVPGGLFARVTEKPFATRILDERVVLYRILDFSMVAARDICYHRSVPLSLGHVEGDERNAGQGGAYRYRSGVLRWRCICSSYRSGGALLGAPKRMEEREGSQYHRAPFGDGRVVVESPTLAAKALQQSPAGATGFADLLIAEVSFAGGVSEIITFDKAFGRLSRVHRLS